MLVLKNEVPYMCTPGTTVPYYNCSVRVYTHSTQEIPVYREISDFFASDDNVCMYTLHTASYVHNNKMHNAHLPNSVPATMKLEL